MKCLLTVTLVAPVLAQDVILLRPNEKADLSAPAEKVEQRGKNGLDDRAISNVSRPSITVYLPAKEKATGTGMIICPGGGYQHLAIDKEGHDVARWLNTIGIAGFVLKYRLPGQGSLRRASGDLHQIADAIHVALEDAESSMRLVRENAVKWSLKPDAIGMMGFSAGGHLAAMMGMISPIETRPDFLVLGYPAIPAALDVTPSTPRTFLVAAYDDPLLNPAEHAGRFFAALRTVKVPAEIHIYASGGHGFGMLKTGKTSATWPDALVAWLKESHLE